ncbi:MAG: hypothetical protein HYS57_02375 [Parcubacteria group bacterium]|nr:hypothetical protein [Parcubacteria group bacterium]
MKPDRNFTTGQTLIEMVVSLGIVLVLLSMLILYSRQGESSAKLLRERQKLVFNLRRAQDFALGTREFTVGEIPCGYGIHFDADTTRYFIFADRLVGGGSCSGSFAGKNQRNPNRSEDVERVDLEKGIEVLTTNVDDIVFTPPEPKTNFLPPVAEALITLSLETGASVTASVKVTSQGEVAIVP